MRTYVWGGCLNFTEIYIEDLCKQLGIYSHTDLTVDNIAGLLQIEVIYWPYSSEITNFKGIYKIFLDENLNPKKRWQIFGHEMYHYFRDHISYDRLPASYSFYGENKAEYFAYHFCVPTFMLNKIYHLDVNIIMSLFNVEFDFALKRLEMYSYNLT